MTLQGLARHEASTLTGQRLTTLSLSDARFAKKRSTSSSAAAAADNATMRRLMADSPTSGDAYSRQASTPALAAPQDKFYELMKTPTAGSMNLVRHLVKRDDESRNVDAKSEAAAGGVDQSKCRSKSGSELLREETVKRCRRCIVINRTVYA